MPGDSRNASSEDVAAFAARWRDARGELANAQGFLADLCRLLDLPEPEPRRDDPALDAYCFERSVTFQNGDGSTAGGRIDLYRRGHFVLEAKQIAPTAQQTALPGLIAPSANGGKTWDVALKKARNQAERYARALHDAGEAWPPLLLVVDVGRVIELYQDFSQSGRTYLPFPDPASYRIAVDDLAKPEAQERLRAAWLNPLSLDPSRKAARVTREIAATLATLARSLEESRRAGRPDAQRLAAQEVAEFLMRCLFTMFAEDVELLPKAGFTRLLKDNRDEPDHLRLALESLWRAMRTGVEYDTFLRSRVLHFNGGLFENATALPLTKQQIDLLIDAAQRDWREVEPAIFGTLLERALDPLERHKLGAHYTPRAYVERLVVPTLVEPLREDWQAVETAAQVEMDGGRPPEARKLVRDFLDRLRTTRVLDPACGSGNFLYIALEHMKRLEGEVLERLEELGETQIEAFGVDPKQFLGIELNPRAAKIAETVLWIGYLQWHVKTRAGRPLPSPVLKAYGNIREGDAVLTYDKQELDLDEHGQPRSRWDGRTTRTHPVTGKEVPDETARVELYRYSNPRPAEWPEAEFIIGNPPFIGATWMREALGDGYTEALRKAYPDVAESSDFVLYWWYKAAELTRKGTARRFGLITTNSIRQTFGRRVIQRQLSAKPPLVLLFAIPDHPWVDTADGADVRIAMTVGALSGDGRLQVVISESEGDDGERNVVLSKQAGKINADLTIGADVSTARALKANDGLASPGMKLHGAGFIVTPAQAEALGLGRIAGLERHIRDYRNGRDLTGRPRGVLLIDLWGLQQAEVAARFPEINQFLMTAVRGEREAKATGGPKDAQEYARKWWLFGKPRQELRKALLGLGRYIVTVETAKHRTFQFLQQEIIPDNMLICVGDSDAFVLGVLSSCFHISWALATGGRLGVGNDPRYNKSRCFDTFPFPDPPEPLKARIRDLGERLDAHRKRQQALHPGLTLTEIYNVLEALRAGRALSDKERVIHEQGLVSVLKEIHDQLDAAVAEAYGWPADLADAAILERLVALNRERAAEEAEGKVRWLRPEFQNPAGTTQPTQTAISLVQAIAEAGATRRPWPTALPEQVKAVQLSLREGAAPARPDQVARRFKRARTSDVEEVLQALVALGQARVLGDGRFVG